jgi:hypothetical protein
MSTISAASVRRNIIELTRVHSFLDGLRGKLGVAPLELGHALAWVAMVRDDLARASCQPIEVEAVKETANAP